MSLYSVYEGDFYDVHLLSTEAALTLSPKVCVEVLARRLGVDSLPPSESVELRQRIVRLCNGDNGAAVTSPASLLLSLSTSTQRPGNNINNNSPTNVIHVMSPPVIEVFEARDLVSSSKQPRQPVNADDKNTAVEIAPSDSASLDAMSTWMPYALAAIIGTCLCVAAIIIAVFIIRRFSSFSRTSRPYNRSNNETPVMVTFHRPGSGETSSNNNSGTDNMSSLSMTTKPGAFCDAIATTTTNSSSETSQRPASTTQTRRKLLPRNHSSGTNSGSTSLWVDCADEIVRLLTVEQQNEQCNNKNMSKTINTSYFYPYQQQQLQHHQAPSFITNTDNMKPSTRHNTSNNINNSTMVTSTTLPSHDVANSLMYNGNRNGHPPAPFIATFM